MKAKFRWGGRGGLPVAAALMLIACGGQATPPPVAATNTPLPAAPTEAPTSTPPPTATDTPQPTPNEVPTSTPTPAPTNTPQPAATQAPTRTPTPASTDTAQSAPTEAAGKPLAELAEAANQVYTQQNCSVCHGANYEGGFAAILAGLPAAHIQAVTRSGEPEAGMPAYDQNVISDEDLGMLAGFLSSLTLQDIGVELPPAVVESLSQAWDALQAGDKAAVETHLEKAQEAGANTPPGVQATLKSLFESLGQADWIVATEVHLEVLLGQ